MHHHRFGGAKRLLIIISLFRLSLSRFIYRGPAGSLVRPSPGLASQQTISPVLPQIVAEQEKGTVRDIVSPLGGERSVFTEQTQARFLLLPFKSPEIADHLFSLSLRQRWHAVPSPSSILGCHQPSVAAGYPAPPAIDEE